MLRIATYPKGRGKPRGLSGVEREYSLRGE